MKRTPLKRGNSTLLGNKPLSTRQIKKSGLVLRSSKMKKSTKEARNIKEDYRATCQEISEERDAICEGCESALRPLSFSHLISRKERKDLIANKKNIHIHCMSFMGVEGCHDKYEKGDYSDLKDIEKIKEAIRELDPELYRRKFD